MEKNFVPTNEIKEIINTKPVIFTKKVNLRHKIIPLNKRLVILGPTKHFPSSIREWNDSIYTYNNNNMNNISVNNKNISNLIRSYFNLYFKNNFLNSTHIPVRDRRLALNTILLSKLNIKHSNEKIIITLFVFNQEKRRLIRDLSFLREIIFSSKNYISLKGKPASILNFMNFYKHIKETLPLKTYLNKLFNSVIIERDMLINIIKNKNILKISIINKEKSSIEKLELVLIKLNDIINLCDIDKNFYNKLNLEYKSFIRNSLFRDKLKEMYMYKLLLNLNKNKFDDIFLSRLRLLIKKIYKKDIEFNIINLKNLYLNSSMFTEAVSVKLKNRDNSLLRVLRTSLSMIKLTNVNSQAEKYKKIRIKELFVNKTNNLYIKSIIGRYNEDALNKLLFKIFHKSSLSVNTDINKGDSLIENTVLNALKFKNLGGVRLEAKGRLTKRFTASRSLFKVRWVGSLKNLESSFRGWSSVTLRGNTKSNVEYSLVNSKTRNGAFGLKGWISGK